QRKYRERGRRNLLVSTPDLLHKLPGARWQPNLVPVHEPRYLPFHGAKPGPPDRPVTIAHSPTRKDLKNTDDLLTAVEALQSEGLPVTIDMLDAHPHKVCLERKRRAHVCFDHLQGYYGMSSLEALSQGLPVVAGINAWNERSIKERFGVDSLPWVVSDPVSLPGDLRGLVTDADRRNRLGEESRRFMVEHWNDRAVAGQLAAFYADLES
ncbi:MAG: glycosyltransferase, partial [Oceanidesulfovibrio sp.]